MATEHTGPVGELSMLGERAGKVSLAGGTASNQGDPLARLVGPTVSGDVLATRQLLNALGRPMLGVVRRILGSRHSEVEDVTQEAMFEVPLALVRFRGECTVTHFACRIAVLTAMNARRRHLVRLRVNAPFDDGAAQAEAKGPSPVEMLEQEQYRHWIRSLLDGLPPAQAEALALHCVLGYTLEETAQTTGATLNTVRGRLSRAKAALRRTLAGSEIGRELSREEASK